MKSFSFVLGGIMCLLFFSCTKKQNDSTSVTVTYPNYAAFAIGNYWVYQEFKIGLNGTATPLNITDSTYIEKDTVIANETYFKLVNIPSNHPTQPEITFQRVIENRIEDYGSMILFTLNSSPKPTYSTLILGNNDTIGNFYHIMDLTQNNTTVPAGTFVTHDMQYQFHFVPGYDYFGSLRILHHRYAENVGLVLETRPFYLDHDYYIEKQLLRFHIN